MVTEEMLADCHFVSKIVQTRSRELLQKIRDCGRESLTDDELALLRAISAASYALRHPERTS